MFNKGDEAIFTNDHSKYTSWNCYKYQKAKIVHVISLSNGASYHLQFSDGNYIYNVDIGDLVRLSEDIKSSKTSLAKLSKIMQDNNLSEDDVIGVLNWHLNK